ncbi:signal peptidase II [Fannyhessea vaginae]|uniref:signal peptidase II n=1 Tax=Fannyhessea vaginae TaxID=82135 RepID=UPI003A80DBF0
MTKQSSKQQGLSLPCLLTLFICACVLVGIDQLSKCIVRDQLPLFEKRPFLEGIIEFYHVENSGAAFSFAEGALPFFVICALVALSAIFYYLIRKCTNLFLGCTLMLIASGALGNLIDRLIYHTVCDFFATQFISFPIFNIADIYVTLGACGVFICSYVFSRNQAQDE